MPWYAMIQHISIQFCMVKLYHAYHGNHDISWHMFAMIYKYSELIPPWYDHDITMIYFCIAYHAMILGITFIIHNDKWYHAMIYHIMPWYHHVAYTQPWELLSYDRYHAMIWYGKLSKTE